MTDAHINLTDQVAELSRPEKIYFDTILKKSDENIFVSIKNLRKQFETGEIEPEYLTASTLALAAMESHLRGESKFQPATEAEALADMQDRIRAAAASGDRELYDSLRAGLAHVAETAIANDERNAARIQKLEASRDAMEAETKDKYETMLRDFKDSEIQNLRHGGMPADEAESHFQQWSASRLEDSARKASGYSHREPLALEE
jgi:hypothetical protein